MSHEIEINLNLAEQQYSTKRSVTWWGPKAATPQAWKKVSLYAARKPSGSWPEKSQYDCLQLWVANKSQILQEKGSSCPFSWHGPNIPSGISTWFMLMLHAGMKLLTSITNHENGRILSTTITSRSACGKAFQWRYKSVVKWYKVGSMALLLGESLAHRWGK